MDEHVSDMLLTGIPRGGTTLACRLLGDCIDTIALSEPIVVESIPATPAHEAVTAILAFFAGARAQLISTGQAPSKVKEGAIPDNLFSPAEPGGKRKLIAREGMLTLASAPPPAFTLAIKHNAMFTALLPQLLDRIRVVAIVRNPLAVLASWNSLLLPVSRGSLPAGERFDTSLSSRLNNRHDTLDKQLLILDWFFGIYSRLSDECVVRYEDLVSTCGQRLFDAAGVKHPGGSLLLADRNLEPPCERKHLPRLAKALASHQGAWTGRYAPSSIDLLLQELMDAL